MDRKWWALAAVGSGTFMATVDGSIVNIALKTLQDAFQAELSSVEWVVLSYLLTITCLLPSMGRLGDMIGKRSVYVAGFVVFTAGSALCGLAWNIESMVAFRIVQAIGAALIQAVGPGLLVTAFPANERGQALGYIGTIVAAGISAGPVIGGLLLRYASWPSIFYVNVPIGIAAIFLALRALPNDQKLSEQRFDIPGAGFLGGGLLLILFALTEGQHWGFSDARTIGMLGTGLLGMGLFVWWEQRTSNPMISISLFANRSFSLSLMAAFMVFLAMSFNFLLLPFFLQNALHFDPQQTGLTLIASPLVLSLTAPISGRISDRIGTRWIAVAGLIIITLGLLSMTTITIASSQLEIAARMGLIGAGMGLFQSPNNSNIMGNVPRSALGIAGSLQAVMRNMGSTAGVALAGAIWATRVNSAADQVYNPVTSAPVGALASGFHDAMLVAGILAALAIIPTLTRSGHATIEKIIKPV